MLPNDPAPAALFHRSTVLGEPPPEPERIVDFRPLERANRPPPFKRYLAVEPRRRLPRALLRSRRPAVEVLTRVSAGGEGRADWKLLGTLLHLAGGVTRVRGAPQPNAWYRAAMSAGNLHPVETYLLHQGLWHYQPLEHELVPLRPAREVGGGTQLVLTGIPFRTCWKYRERGWRHLFWDAGAIAANVLAVAAAHDLPARIVVGFDDAAVVSLLGLDPSEEVPLALVELGPAPPPLPLDLPPLEARSSPVAPAPVRFPLLEEAHSAGVLPAEAVPAWRSAGHDVSRPAALAVEAPQPSGHMTIEQVVLRRGSTRAFRPDAVPPAVLDWALAAATLAVPWDLAPAGTLLDHFVSVHAVEGQPAGRCSPGGPLAEAPEADERAAAAALCLDQALGGDSAYTAFHGTDCEGVLAALGSRGYRAAQLESGVVAGRLSLCAFALGAGATGLTFYDSQVSRHFRTTAAPMLATAVGMAVTRSRRGGPPDRPAVLPAP